MRKKRRDFSMFISRDIVRLVKEYLRPYWLRMTLVVLAASASAMAPYMFGYLGKVMVDDVLRLGGERTTGVHQSATAVQHTDGVTDLSTTSPSSSAHAPERPDQTTQREQIHLLLLVFLAYIGVHLASIGLTWLYSYNIAYVGQRIVYKMRRQLHEKLQNLHMAFFDQRKTGKLVARVIDDVNVIQNNVTNTFINIFSNIALLAVGVFILLRLDWKLALVAFSFLPFYGISYQYFIKRIRKLNLAIREKNAEIYGLLGEKITGVRVIKSFAQERFEVRQFFRKSSEFIRLVIKNSLLNNTLGALAILISGIGTAVVLWYGALMVRNGDMSLGSLLYFYASVGVLFSPLIALTNVNVVIQRVLTVLARIFAILDEEVKIKDAENAIELKEMKGAVSFHNVSLKYEGSDGYALREVSFDIPAGSVVSLVGPSGSGKSSLVNLLLRLYEPTEGYILLDGHDIADIKLSSLRRHIGMVPQEAILFSGTIAQNIMYGRFDATPQEVINAAKASEIHDFIYSLPEKYETQIGEAGVSLSGGQKQRLAMAMALLTDPSILILDDSTSALDGQTEARIWETLRKIMKNRTSFIITHRIRTAMSADIILVLDKGRLVEKGTHQELVARDGFYRRIFKQQMEVKEAA
ncbi:MAG TPA: ABC transporter ATP-binding protein [Candidatus Latescibacteria bacterium]|nr:ABC transporter ATP-binding protein [Candidatus Latescibacterota bacterium]